MTVQSLANRFRRDARGVTAIEFGILAFPFLAVILAIFELAYVQLESELLSGAVTKASRAMLTGSTQANATVTTASAFVQTYLCPSTGTRIMPTNFDCSQLIVDVRPVSSFNSGDMTNDIYKSGSTQFCPGAPGQIVLMRIAYPLPAIVPLNLFSRTAGVVSDVPGKSGLFHILMGSALFQEEAYTNSYTPPPGC